ncbi:hypothetical protein AAVH_12921 [Aphelenchoides avenae]|nr:hypothetical protein AAVH_12921 [Aphelenchus avenae]
MLVVQFQPGKFAVLITLCMSLITLANPLTIIYFVSPFRKAVGRTISKVSKSSRASKAGGTPVTSKQYSLVDSQPTSGR